MIQKDFETWRVDLKGALDRDKAEEYGDMKEESALLEEGFTKHSW